MVRYNVGSFFVAHVKDMAHFYWPYARVTLCGRDKVNRPTFYWWESDFPLCPECCVEKVKLEMRETRRAVA
jgi:hypothetical protein